MSQTNVRWLPWVVFALGAALAIFVATRFERVPREVEVGYRGEARRNSLLAAERTLTSLGMPAKSVESLRQLPGTDATLILRDSGRFLAPATIERLVGWADAGGNLVLLFPGDSDLLDQIEDDIEEGRFEMPLAEALGVHCVLHAPTDGTWLVDLGAGELEIALPGRFAFENTLGTADLVVGEDMSARIVSFERGLGRVTLVADDNWATNERLLDHDHADVLWELANLEGMRPSALVVFSEEPPGLLHLIWEHGWAAVVAGAALLVLLLWRAGSRFGPLLPELSHDRRDFSEHVVASGEFLWRHRASRALLAAPHAELRRRVAVVRPDWSELTERELAERIAAETGLEPASVARALETVETTDVERFVSTVRVLQSARKSL